MPRILIVDDSELILRRHADTLRQATDADLLMAKCGADAEVPVIVVSGTDDHVGLVAAGELERLAHEHDADGYISKTDDPAVLAEAVATYLRLTGPARASDG